MNKDEVVLISLFKIQSNNYICKRKPNKPQTKLDYKELFSVKTQEKQIMFFFFFGGITKLTFGSELPHSIAK